MLIGRSVIVALLVSCACAAAGEISTDPAADSSQKERSRTQATRDSVTSTPQTRSGRIDSLMRASIGDSGPDRRPRQRLTMFDVRRHRDFSLSLRVTTGEYGSGTLPAFDLDLYTAQQLIDSTIFWPIFYPLRFNDWKSPRR
ncbi:MAG: hypothetical protein P8181_15560 [bacterium]